MEVDSLPYAEARVDVAWGSHSKRRKYVIRRGFEKIYYKNEYAVFCYESYTTDVQKKDALNGWGSDADDHPKWCNTHSVNSYFDRAVNQWALITANKQGCRLRVTPVMYLVIYFVSRLRGGVADKTSPHIIEVQLSWLICSHSVR